MDFFRLLRPRLERLLDCLSLWLIFRNSRFHHREFSIKSSKLSFENLFKPIGEHHFYTRRSYMAKKATRRARTAAHVRTVKSMARKKT